MQQHGSPDWRMSWPCNCRDLDGSPVTVHMAIRDPALDFAFASVPCYQPLYSGLRHLTTYSAQPPTGTHVMFLCELSFDVPRRNRTPYVYDCSCCRDVYLAEHR